MPSTLVSESSSRWSGERTRVTEVSIVAIRPISVSMPVAVTSIAPVPRVTEVFWNSMSARSPSGVVGRGQRRRVLGHRRALAGQRRLLGLERRRAEQPAVGGDDVAGLDLDDVARDDVGRRHLRDRAVAPHAAVRHLHLRQRVDARPRLQLLARAEHEVEDHEQRDEDRGRHLADDEAHGGDRDEHQVHRLAQLRERDRRHGRRLLAADLVGPVLRQPRRRLGLGQAELGVAAEGGEDRRLVLREPARGLRLGRGGGHVDDSRVGARRAASPARGDPAGRRI